MTGNGPQSNDPGLLARLRRHRRRPTHTFYFTEQIMFTKQPLCRRGTQKETT